MDPLPSAFLLDVDLFVCVRLHVLQPVRLSVHDLVGRFHEPEGGGKRPLNVIPRAFSHQKYLISKTST